MADLMKQANKLLPCPFCGEAAKHTVWGDAGFNKVECTYCDVGMDYFYHQDDAFEAWNRRAALRAAPEGFALVPVEPSLGVPASMAIRRDHGLGCPGYYDAPVFGAENVGHQRRMEVAIGEARQQYEEVVGNGFYSLDREGHYAGLAARPQGVK